MEKHGHRDRSRSRGRYTVSSVQQVASHEDRSQTAVYSGPQVLWLVDQSEHGWPSYWRVAEKNALSMENQFQNGTESVNGELVFDGGEVHYYRQTMINGAEMRQIRFHDEERSRAMFNERLARVIVQTSRDDTWGPRTPPRS